MTNEQFVYWLKGYLTGAKRPKVDIIQEQLKKVYLFPSNSGITWNYPQGQVIPLQQPYTPQKTTGTPPPPSGIEITC